MSVRGLRILVVALIGMTLSLHPAYLCVAEISNNFSDFVHINGPQEESRKESASGLSPLDQLRRHTS